MIKVLIVDDNNQFRKSLIEFLAIDSTIDVVGQAEDGHQALEKIRSLRPDMVLMDIKMKGMNGLNATERLKAEFPEIPVIILSRYDLIAYQDAAEAAGAKAYIVKKSMADELLPTIQRMMNNGHSQKNVDANANR